MTDLRYKKLELTVLVAVSRLQEKLDDIESSRERLWNLLPNATIEDLKEDLLYYCSSIPYEQQEEAARALQKAQKDVEASIPLKSLFLANLTRSAPT